MASSTLSPPSTSITPRITSRRSSKLRATLTIADKASWYCSIIIVALILFSTFKDTYPTHLGTSSSDDHDLEIKGTHILDRPCDEIYVVGEGETLHTISDKCGDPYIVERNPHIHDPDDVFPGLVIRVMPVDPKHHRQLMR